MPCACSDSYNFSEWELSSAEWRMVYYNHTFEKEYSNVAKKDLDNVIYDVFEEWVAKKEIS